MTYTNQLRVRLLLALDRYPNRFDMRKLARVRLSDAGASRKQLVDSFQLHDPERAVKFAQTIVEAEPLVAQPSRILVAALIAHASA